MIQDAGDFYGKHVNLAARIVKAARGSEILVSSLLRELAAGGGEITFGDPRDVDLKGIAGTQRAFRCGVAPGRRIRPADPGFAVDCGVPRTHHHPHDRLRRERLVRRADEGRDTSRSARR